MIGKTISHYRILEKIGGGGMGVVYKAEDTRLKRLVALKFLPPDLTRDSEAKGRFINEAQSASSLDHPNICTVFEIGEDDEGQMFIAMAYYEGETLKDKIAAGRIEEGDALRIGNQIASGLSEAHVRGIIHRDIKPANILITQNGVAKILDFGLAKATGTTRLTREGSTLGTIAYMAPEQLRGLEADARADMFSLAVVIYEMLSGHLPFRGEHEAALMYSIVNEDPVPLREFPEIQESFGDILNKALEKDPEHRYQSMAEFLKDLAQAGNVPIKSSASAPHRKIHRINSFTIRVVLGVAALAILATIAMLWPVGPSDSPASPEVPKTLRVTIFAIEALGDVPKELAATMAEAIEAELAARENLVVISRNQAHELLKEMGFQGEAGCTGLKCIVQFGKMLDVDRALVGSIRRTEGSLITSIQVLDIHTGQIVQTATEEFGGELSKLSVEVVREIAQQLYGELVRKKLSAAVLDFGSQGGVALGDLATLSGAFQAQLAGRGGLILVDRAKIREIFAEQGFQQSGPCSEVGCFVEAGKILKVNRIYTGSIQKIGQMFTINIMVIDVSKALIIENKSRQHRGTIEDLYYRIIPDMADQILENLSSAQTIDS